MSTPSACPACGGELPAAAEACPGCGRAALFGLVAEPVLERARVESAAAVLSAVPGGPSLAEARRRVGEGLPLLVGLSRAECEELQGRLVDAGLVARMGPAPLGTAPLRPPRRGPLWRPVLVALAAAAGIVAVIALDVPKPEPGGASPPPRSPASPVAASPTPAPAPAIEFPPVPEMVRLELRAQLRRSGTDAVLRGVVSAETRHEPPAGELQLQLYDADSGASLLREERPGDSARDSLRSVDGVLITFRAIAFELRLPAAVLEGRTRLLLVAQWDDWRSRPLELPGLSTTT